MTRRNRVTCVGALAQVAVLVLVGCGRHEPVGPAAVSDPTAQLPARFKVQAPVAAPDFSQAATSPAFQLAVADAARLLASTAQPLRSAGEGAEVIGGVSFEVPRERGEEVLREEHGRFLERGAYLFLHEQGFGIDGRPDLIGLLPTTDRYAVMAAMETNGDNYGIGTAGVIAWMRELEAEQAHELTGIGFDFLAGTFTAPVRDPDRLALRMYQFCPDIVDQGVGGVAQLAAEIRKGRLYFWWD